MRCSRAGFTLIELLIVVGIIGVLSTLAMVNISSSREKARIARALAYASQMKRAAMDSAAALWDMDDCMGGTIIDRSGLGNNGTLSNTTWITDTPNGIGCALAFNRSMSSYVSAGTAQALNLANQNFSVCAWIRTQGTNFMDIFSNRPATNGGFEFAVYANHLRSQVWYGGSTNLLEGTTVVNDGKWHYVCQIVDTTKTSLSIDGRIDASADLAGAKVKAASSAPYIGSRNGTAQFFTGSIDDVSVYAMALTMVSADKDLAQAK